MYNLFIVVYVYILYNTYCVLCSFAITIKLKIIINRICVINCVVGFWLVKSIL